MKEAHYSWSLPNECDQAQELVPELERLNIAPMLSSFLWQRGIKKPQEIESFFSPKLSDFHDPFLLYDMEKTVIRIQKAVEKGEKILVYGDYDADGITSATLMKEAIELIGGDVSHYIPNRFSDGYGPNKDVYKKMIDNGVQLIITVDNGVSGHEAIEYASEQGVDVIVTDHHEMPETLPNAFSIVHPRHPRGNYPFKDLAGVGVAFKVATALLGEVPIESIDLVAIGTIADLVQLTGENRAFVKLGLEQLKRTDRVGLQMLAKEAQVDLLDVNEETIGFQIAPRLNAIGRIGDATPAVTLLSTFDEEEAVQLAKEINESNQKRQEIVKKITEEALEMAKVYDEDDLLFLIGKDWHEGVLGIVASHIVQKTGKPTIVLKQDEQTGDLKGSGRSIGTIDLFKLFTRVKEKLTSFGGHHMAIGLSFKNNQLESVKDELNSYIKSNELVGEEKESISIDKTLALDEVTIDYIKTLSLLAPFGHGNPAPLFLIEESNIKNFKKIGSEGAHLKGELIDQERSLDCIAFNKGDEVSEFSKDDKISIVGKLSINEWNGHRKPQLMLTDYQIKGCQLFDMRGKNGERLDKETSKKRTYLAFNESYKPPESLIEETIFFVTKDKPMDYDQLNRYEEIVILDCPYDLEKAKEVFSQLTITRIFLKIDVETEHYLTGLPTRKQFGDLFKFISTYPSVDIRFKLDNVSKHLKIKKNLLTFMIHVFFELGFVTIEDGLMKKKDAPKRHSLEESKLYQDYENKIEMEKLFLYSDIKDIKKWLLHQEETK